MNIVYITVFILLLLFILIFYSNLIIHIKMHKDKEDEKIQLNLSTLRGLIKVEAQIPFIDIMKNGRASSSIRLNTKLAMIKKHIQLRKNKEILTIDEIKLMKKKITALRQRYKTVVEYVNKKIILNEISWITEVGTGDAASTAIVTGFLWIIKSNLLALVNYKSHINSGYVNVIPLYGPEEFNTTFHCIITFKIGYIIIAGIKLLTVNYKDGDRKNE